MEIPWQSGTGNFFDVNSESFRQNMEFIIDI